MVDGIDNSRQVSPNTKEFGTLGGDTKKEVTPETEKAKKKIKFRTVRDSSNLSKKSNTSKRSTKKIRPLRTSSYTSRDIDNHQLGRNKVKIVKSRSRPYVQNHQIESENGSSNSPVTRAAKPSS